MPSLREADPVAYAIAHAREREAERIAELVGVPMGKIRSWRKGSLDLSPWVIDTIARVLRIDDQVIEQHHQLRRRRHAQDVAVQRDLEQAA